MLRLDQACEEFAKLEQGGPLLFTKKLSTNALRAFLKKHMLRLIPETVKTPLSIVPFVSTRIWHSHDKSFPDRFIDDVVNLYQTSGCVPCSFQ